MRRFCSCYPSEPMHLQPPTPMQWFSLGCSRRPLTQLTSAQTGNRGTAPSGHPAAVTTAATEASASVLTAVSDWTSLLSNCIVTIITSATAMLIWTLVDFDLAWNYFTWNDLPFGKISLLLIHLFLNNPPYYKLLHRIPCCRHDTRRKIGCLM